MRVLTIDIGNTSTKAALFGPDGGMTLVESLNGVAYDRAIACVSGKADGLPADVQQLGPDTEVPIAVAYDRAALGPDRLAAACGAWALAGGADCVVVDAGTCITVDLVRSGTYVGGAIMPGIAMQLQALHSHTAHLPQIGMEQMAVDNTAGGDTAQSIALGVGQGTVCAIEGLTSRYEADGKCRLFLTGGNAAMLQRCGLWQGREHSLQPSLVLYGLYRITQCNLK
ncbi:MAG: type III pantothenate kinase [Bacteroidales bacterium]|nr:type III pantothenate kinase [Bacteroidales bacterium]